MASGTSTESASGTTAENTSSQWNWWPSKISGKPWNVSDTMLAWGLWKYYDPNDPAAPLYKIIVPASNPLVDSTGKDKDGMSHAVWTPAGFTGSLTPSGNTIGAYEIFMEMCLRARALVYCETAIGDCGVEFAPSGPSTGLVVGEQLAGAASSLIPIPGLGAVVGAGLNDLIGLLSGAEHKAAVANEKSVLCQLAQNFGQSIQSVYTAFYQEQLAGSEAYAYMKQLATDFHNQYAEANVKVKKCNAGCGMDGIMAAHVALAGYLFGITPLPPGVQIAIPSGSTAITPTVAPLIADTVPVEMQAQASAGAVQAAAPSTSSLFSGSGFLILLFIAAVVLIGVLHGA